MPARPPGVRKKERDSAVVVAATDGSCAKARGAVPMAATWAAAEADRLRFWGACGAVACGASLASQGGALNVSTVMRATRAAMPLTHAVELPLTLITLLRRSRRGGSSHTRI